MHTNVPYKDITEKQAWSIFLSEKYRTGRCGPFTPPEGPDPNDELWINPHRLFEGCAVRTGFSGVGGTVIGMLMGGFFHTMGPLDINEKLSTWQQLKQSYKGFGASCARMGKGFGKVGLVYSATECFIEQERGTHDMANAVYAGCATGGFLAMQAGPQAAFFGCAGFAAFSACIETLMGNH